MTSQLRDGDSRFGLPEGSVNFVDALGQDPLEYWLFVLRVDPCVALSVDSYVDTVNELFMIATPESSVTAVASFVRLTLSELGWLDTSHGDNVLRYTVASQEWGRWSPC